MSERDDIEFDFFEESDTRETQEERPRRGPRPPVRPPTGLTPLLRLIGLISFAILIVLLLVLWVNGCRENKRKDAYRHYVQKVAGYGQQSQRLGRSFNQLLTTRGTKESDVESELSGLARQQEQIASAARGLDPPGHLRDEDAHMLDSLDLRTNGLRGMTDAFQSTASSKNASTAGGEESGGCVTCHRRAPVGVLLPAPGTLSGVFGDARSAKSFGPVWLGDSRRPDREAARSARDGRDRAHPHRREGFPSRHIRHPIGWCSRSIGAAAHAYFDRCVRALAARGVRR